MTASSVLLAGSLSLSPPVSLQRARRATTKADTPDATAPNMNGAMASAAHCRYKARLDAENCDEGEDGAQSVEDGVTGLGADGPVSLPRAPPTRVTLQRSKAVWLTWAPHSLT